MLTATIRHSRGPRTALFFGLCAPESNGVAGRPPHSHPHDQTIKIVITTLLRHALPRPLTTVAALMLALASVMAFGPPAQAHTPTPDRQTARYEIRFMTTMIDHHAMAIEMSQICVNRAIHLQLEDMCSQVIASQQSEIETMQGWLSYWYDVDYQPALGVGDVRSMTRLERLDVPDFEIAFMELMSRHHWKAVTEAKKCVDKATHDELVSMCQDIIGVQLAEIDRMQTWLCRWYQHCGGRVPHAS